MNSKNSPSYNQTSKLNHERFAHDSTPNKHRTPSTSNLINLSQYFGKRNTMPLSGEQEERSEESKIRREKSPNRDIWQCTGMALRDECNK